MRAPLLVSLLALGLAGLAVLDPFDAAPERAPVTGPDEGEVVKTLSTRLAALEAENLRLAGRLAALESQPRAAEPARAPVELRAPATEGGSAAAPEAKRILDADEALRHALEDDAGFFEARVTQTLEKVRKDEQVAKVQAYHEKRLAQLDADVERFTEKLELDAYQAQQLRTALLAQYDRDTALTQLWDQGASDEVLGEQKQADGAAFTDDLGAFLSDQQLQTFWSTAHGK